MQSKFAKRLLSFLLAAVMAAGVLTSLHVFADDDAGEPEPEAGKATEVIFHSNLAGGDAGSSYSDYSERYGSAQKASESIVIDATDYDPANTTAEVRVLENIDGVSKALYMPSTGITSWKVSVPENALYAIRITYYPIAELDGVEVTTYTTIERTLYIDGRIPFSEARYFYFPRNWVYQDVTRNDDGTIDFRKDAMGNDVRPIRGEAPAWQTYYLRDWLGYTMSPFEFYLSKGEHTISFDASREGIVISKIEFYRYDEEPTFADFLTSMQAKGVKVIDKMGDGIIKVQAENPDLVSNACLYPTNDRTSSLTEPQDPQRIRNNIVNSTTVNEWMKYTVTVPEAGLYTIAIRFRQNDLIGMFTSRRILINGEQQFKEAGMIRFKYNPSWQSSIATDGENKLLFYLEVGENEITFEAVLGEMTDYVYRIEGIIEDLNKAYTTILQLTGPTPDAYRDYGFNRLVPGAVNIIRAAAIDLYEISDELEAVTGELGDQVATLDTIALLLETMGDDEYKIAPNFVTFKNYIIALSNWLYAALKQPCKIDYFTVQGQNDPLPKDKSGLFSSLGFEIRAFFGSFFMDYTTVDFASDIEYSKEDTVNLWITSALGREDALIKRNLVDKYFTPEYGVTVKMKVITTGLTEAILAGIGPDVAIMTSVDTITWGLRNAVYPMEEFDGFDEVMSWFSEEEVKPLQMYDAHGVPHTYGLPFNIDFYMMFYRADVFDSMGLKVPKTWNDLYDILPALLNSDMIVGMMGSGAGTEISVTGYTGLKQFLYQMGGEVFNDGGYSVALDENVALDAFESYTELFSLYKSQVNYSITRFRTGEMPIFFGSATACYNLLMSYYDIRGLWEMAPLLGFEQEDGTINHTSTVTVTSYILPRGSNTGASWKYLKWEVSPEQQRRMAKETLAVNANPTTKYNTATVSAFLGQAWTTEEYAAISEQFSQIAGIREFPGNYIIPTYVDAAFFKAYGQASDASDELLDRMLLINKELSRKRDDFKMDYYDLTTGQYVKGRYISEPISWK
ncbi:MAG: extracellular solute-binding protein [Clostridia bacterium]|nr:extracellular solute-binding protein [Clostridia bacterium]